MILHIADGAKGGVGKSQTAQILINYLSRGERPIIAIETDTQIPDVARGVEKTERNIRLEFADLRTDEGWQLLLEELQTLAQDEETRDNHVIMSLPGADLDVPKYADLLNILTEALGIQIWDWFVLNTQKDSVSLLKASLKEGFASIAARRIAAKNGYFGKPEAFIDFDSDKALKSALDGIVYIEQLTPSVARTLRQETRTIDEAAARAKAGIDREKPDILYASNLLNWDRKNQPGLDKIFKDILELN